MDKKALQKIAQRKLQGLVRKKRDPRFQNTVGKLVHLGLLDRLNTTPYLEPIALGDALWAGEVEPRVLELLPALILKKPKVFFDPQNLPEDLRDVLMAVRRGEKNLPDFRGVPARHYMQWISRVGHKNKSPTFLKAFRFTADDQQMLDELKKRLGESEIGVLRLALREYAKKSEPTSAGC